ncbi:MAG: TIGR02147 family protein [Pseudomonadota bacterium]|nr:TIGR02147 family protein [Pseudomonadota bacterium]
MNIFDYDDYKVFTKSKITAMPKRGRGQWLNMARSLRLHTSLISQIFQGDKNLTFEQAYSVAEFLGLINLDLEYYVALVQLERAGTHKIKNLLEKQIREIKLKSTKLVNRIGQSKQLNKNDQATFYSNWFYSATRLLTSIPGMNSLEAISQSLDLSKTQIAETLEFLLSCGLVLEKNGLLTYGPLKTHLPATSPLVGRHHINWRLKAIERANKLTGDELMFTLPVTLSKKDFTKLRNMILQFIENAEKIYSPSDPETLAFMNIDWLLLNKPS